MSSAFSILDSWATVYKYRALDQYARSIFCDRELYFAPPAQLNDPHDCQVDIAAALLDAIMALDVAQVPKDRLPAIEAAKETLMTDSNGISRRLDDARKNYGICSMSAVPDHPLMWSHYADSHAGLCIGFNPRLIRDRRGVVDWVIPLPVYYTDQNPMSVCLWQFITSHFYSMSGGNPPVGSLFRMAVDVSISVKSTAWAYEEEFRYYRPEVGAIGFEPEALVEVILGCRMPPQGRDKVLECLRTPEWSHVVLSEVIKCPHRPSFTIQPLR